MFAISTFRKDFQVAAELVKSLSPAIPFPLEMAASVYRHTKCKIARLVHWSAGTRSVVSIARYRAFQVACNFERSGHVTN